METLKEELERKATRVWVRDADGEVRDVKVVSAYQVAKIAERSVQTVYDQCRRGTLTCYTQETPQGVKRMVPFEDAYDYVVARRVRREEEHNYSTAGVWHPSEEEVRVEDFADKVRKYNPTQASIIERYGILPADPKLVDPDWDPEAVLREAVTSGIDEESESDAE